MTAGSARHHGNLFATEQQVRHIRGKEYVGGAFCCSHREMLFSVA
jgi:hypothetical protein